MQTYHIHINGIVQGVGFRPMVYNIAKQMKLDGYIKNGSDGVHIFFNSDIDVANNFYKKIHGQAPKQSRIISSEIHEVTGKKFTGFSIIAEEDNKEKSVLISPDRSICYQCKAELHDSSNRRYRYPFITCTRCGPRYSIINKLPYERFHTSMEKFVMCSVCDHEYNNVNARRFFSQTNSCTDCGIQLCLHKNASAILSNKNEEVLVSIKNFLEQGKIIAVKGISGYLLLCDAANEKSIDLLRKRKHRISKPFAVLYSNIEQVLQHFEVNKKEKELLQSEEAPIVLLYPKQEVVDHLCIKKIAPGLNRIGVMLSSNPLLELIAADYDKPLIATSANISGSPIIYKDDDALNFLFRIADYVISCNREILVPQDDSVVQVSKYSGQQIMLRRSRGYAPSFLDYQPKGNECVLATGAFLKSTFTLSINKNVFISQYLGSGKSYESQQMYKHTLEHWLSLYQTKPGVIITDVHPGYFSHQYARELAKDFNAEIKYVQHHEAHFAAVLAENNLLYDDEPILGVTWDGTGLGTDGNIWGGEFFKYENNEILRCYHFDYFPVIAGDKPAMEPRIAALCATHDAWIDVDYLKQKFTIIEWNNYQSLLNNATLFSSSAGRIFDAVASLLDVCDKQTYEGEASMYLQAMAEEYVYKNGFEMTESYFKKGAHYHRLPTASLMQQIIMDVKRGKAKNYIAAKFHYSLVCLIDIVAEYLGTKRICFSGGVFQNSLLVDWIQMEHCKTYQLYFHKSLSANDENISFGQFVHYDNAIKSIHKKELTKRSELENSGANNINTIIHF